MQAAYPLKFTTKHTVYPILDTDRRLLVEEEEKYFFPWFFLLLEICLFRLDWFGLFGLVLLVWFDMFGFVEMVC